MLKRCFENATFMLSNFWSNSKDLTFINRIGNNEKQQSLTMESVNFKVLNNSFSGSLKIKASVNAKIKLNGGVSYDETTNVVAIRIDKAKAGFFNVKGKLFKEIKKKESEFLKVSSPYIYLHLGKL